MCVCVCVCVSPYFPPCAHARMISGWGKGRENNHQTYVRMLTMLASYGSSSSVSTDILTHEDAGVHTCSVRDGNGNMGFATTETNYMV